jgi:glutathione S-transferase
VPVLVDGDTVLFDSWTIACHLEQAYPDRPSLFGGDRARDLSRFYIDWADMVLMGALIRLLATDIHDHLHDKDKTYFRQSREKRFGMSLEEFCADRDQSRSNLHRALAPLRATLQRQPYLGGDSPLYADYAVMGGFMWARSISPLKLMEDDDPVTQWRERLLERVGESSRQLLAYA